MSKFWKDFMKLLGVDLAFSSAYQPQSDGQTKVLNRCLESYLRCMSMDKPLQWVRWLPLAQWWYNSTYHSSIQMSPYEALYGFKPMIHIPYIPGDRNVAAVEELHRDREAMIQSLKANLQAARNRMKQMADIHRTERSFKVGDWVYVKLQPYVQTALKMHRNQKLSPRFYGPFLVLECFGKVAYKLDLPTDALIHHTFHVSLLKPAFGSHQLITPLPKAPRFAYSPRAILDNRVIRMGNKMVSQVLVHWNTLAITEATWENVEDFKLRFLSFHF
ncbi:hypothetical protein E3N88_24898 [Mikania micrantha]|uniref:Integrase catalytic domain-containing protein n=1 Tax=Mikania micrantha TaxID=192012 RepID=A0A5N6N4V0_9ASTR|nr:hypothetical protein E3N88_24898 [Mikania micrantha]